MERVRERAFCILPVLVGNRVSVRFLSGVIGLSCADIITVIINFVDCTRWVYLTMYLQYCKILCNGGIQTYAKNLTMYLHFAIIFL